MGDLVKSAKIPKRTQSRSASKKLTSESQPTIIAEPKATTAALPNTVPGAEPAVVPGTETGSVTDGSVTDGSVTDESDWLQSIVSESTVSSDSSHLSFSEVYIDEVERIMGINFESLKRDLELKIENLLELQDVPDLLLDKAYNKVRNSIRTLGYPSDVVNKQTKSTIVSSLLQEINLYFLDKFNIKKDQLLIEQEVPIIWFKYRGKISFAITRSTDMFDGDRSYYFVVECSKSDPLDGLKQCIMYLHRVQRLNPNKNVRSELFFRLNRN